MVYSPRTGILLNNELLDLCWRRRPGAQGTPPPSEWGGGLERGGAAWGPWCEAVRGDRQRGGVQGAGSEARLPVTPTGPLVPGERPPSSMVPSILVNTAQGSKLVIGGAGGELIISAVVQVSLGLPAGTASLGVTQWSCSPVAGRGG